jgi:SARP family transcriptional regulator, regulator of embCAB operon
MDPEASMVQSPTVRIQLCGRFSVEQGGQPLRDLRGRQCRPLLGYLVLHRRRHVARSLIVDALWGERPPAAADSALSALLSNIRKATGWEVAGRGEVILRVPEDAFVDVESAMENIHLAESAAHRGDTIAAYHCANVARYIARRQFLAGFEAPWIEQWRAELDSVHVRALEGFARACLSLGGAEQAGAERATRELIELAPYRESACALRMRALADSGNTAEALLAYESLRLRLREELGASPGQELRALHQQLLG